MPLIPLRLLTFTALLLGLIGSRLPASASSTEATSGARANFNSYCPVTTDERAKPQIWAMWQGQEIHFCCRKCRREFAAKPDAYVAHLPSLSGTAVAQTAGQLTQVIPPTNTVRQMAKLNASGTQTAAASAAGAAHHHVESAAVLLSKRVATFIGKLHPVIVHFPIALILLALLAEMLWWATGQAMFDNAVRFVLPLGAAGALVAAGLGWLDAMFVHTPSDMLHTLLIHRWLGISTALMATVAAGLQLAACRRTNGRLYWAYRLALVAAAILVGLTGHLGGMLIFGSDYFNY